MAKVLIIDDDQNLSKVVGEGLRKLGYEVATAIEGEQGLEVAAATAPDLILCDLDMPGLNGHGFVSRLRGHEILGEIPVIFLSGCADRDQIRRSMNLGADDFLVKPAPLPEIFEAVKARLAWRNIQRQRQDHRLKEAMEVFVGIVHDLDKATPRTQWLAEGTLDEDSTPANEATPPQSSPSILIKKDSRQQFLNLSEVKALLADGEYSQVYWGKDQKMMFRKPLKQWQLELPQNSFVRVHRRAIVNLTFLDFVDKAPNGTLQVHLRDFKEVIPVSQRATSNFNRCLKAFKMH